MNENTVEITQTSDYTISVDTSLIQNENNITIELSNPNSVDVINNTTILVGDLPQGYPLEWTVGDLPISRVSGLDIISGSGIGVTNNSGIYTVSVTGQFGLTGEEVDDRVNDLLVGGSYVNINYNDDLNTLTIGVEGLQPSGNYSVVGHSHNSSDITNFNSSVSGLLPVKNISAGSGIGISSSSGNFIVSVTGTFGLTAEQVDDRVNDLLVASNNITLNYNDSLNTLTIGTSGLQPSGDYSVVGHSHTSSDITNFNSSVSGLLIPYAQLNSPNFSGIPTTPTAPSGTNNTQIANTEFVRNEISNLVNAAPATLDTLNELANALGNDPNFATTITSGLAGKAPLVHSHVVEDITNFTSGVQDNVSTLLVPGNYIDFNYNAINDSLTISVTGLQESVTNILGGSGISVSNVGSVYTIATTGQFGLTGEEVDDRVGNLLVPGTGISLNYNDSNNTLSIASSGLAFISGANFNSLSVSGTPVSVSGHLHNYTDIINWASGIENEVSTLLVAGNYINIDYDNAFDTLTISASGLQPSGNYANSVHSHGNISSSGTIGSLSGLLVTTTTNGALTTSSGISSSYITNFNSSVSGLLPSVTGSGYVNSNFTNNQYVISVSGLQPSGNYSVVGHTHTASDITDFNSSVSGLLPVKDIVAGTGIGIVSTSGIYTINSTVSGVAESASLVTNVFNKTASTINKGSVVYINGGQGDQPTIQLAIASTEMGSSKTYGVVQNNIPSMSAGKVVVAGALTGFNTDQFNPTAPHGDVNGTTLWLSPSVSGAMTTTKPVAPYHMVSVGTIVRTHQNEGVVEVRIQNGFELEELHNVAISGLVDQQSLVYNSGLSLWQNKTLISNYISDFNSSVSGLLPITDIVGGSNITISQSGTIYTIAVTGSLGLTTEEVDDRVSNLLVAGSGISLDYNDGSDTLTIHNTSISPDEIEEYSTTSNFPASGNLNILYIATDTGQMFKWDGEFYYENGPQGASTGSHSDQHANDGTDSIPLREYIIPTFASNTNNLAHNNKDILYISGDANNRELSGLVAPNGCSIKLLVNTHSSNTIILKHQSSNSDPSNRFLIYTGADYYLLPGYSISILYDTNASRWRVL